MPPRIIKHQLTCPFELTSGSFLIGRIHILVIPRNHLLGAIIHLSGMYQVYTVYVVVLLPFSLIESLLWEYHLMSCDRKPLICQSVLSNYIIIISYSINTTEYWLCAVFKENELMSSPLILHKANIL